MTMPNPRYVTVNGRRYAYTLKGGKGRLIGDSSSTIRLVVEKGPNLYFSQVFLSKTWTNEHTNNLDVAPPHKTTFTPGDVRMVILTLGDDQKLPEGFELPMWKLL